MKRIEMTKKSKLWLIAALSAIMIFTLAACGGSDKNSSGLEDGTYTAEFTTDSRMFHVNETKDDKGTLTVKDGKFSDITVSPENGYDSDNDSYPGTAAEAKKQDKDDLLQPTTEKVKYDDGTTEEAYAFDVPVPEIDKEFDCALIGTKGKWYDHKVKVTNPVKEDK